MFSQYGYQLYQVERSKSPGELRAEDASRGEAAASFCRRWAKLSAAVGRPYRRGRAHSHGCVDLSPKVASPGVQRRWVP